MGALGLSLLWKNLSHWDSGWWRDAHLRFLVCSFCPRDRNSFKAQRFFLREDTMEMREITTTPRGKRQPHSTHQHHTYHPRLRQVAPFVLVIFCCAFKLSTIDGVGNATGAAMRRRQRRLRSWLRHERMTVAMTLAEFTHHTALRGPKLAKVGEGVEHEQHDCLRAQKPPLPGVRLGSLLDPGPQRSDRTVRHSAGEAPLLVVASLAGGDEVDATTVSFLLREHLKLRKKEKEEEERRRKREEAQHEARMRELDRRVWAGEQLNPAESCAWRKWAGHLPSEPRRKKKRKKNNFLVLLGLDKGVDVSVIINDKFQLFVFQL